MSRSIIAVLLCCLPLLAAADPRSRFRDIWQAEWAWRLQQQPQLATSVGVHAYDARLGEVGPGAQQYRLEYWRAVLAQLDRLDTARLDGSSRIDYLIYR